MTFLTNTAVNLEFNPMAFVENLKHMGVGMLGIFIVIGIIVLLTMALNKFSNFLVSVGVEIIKISLIPASINTDKG